MPDVHVPTLEGHGRGKVALKLVVEVALISVGVFLGLLGEQWRESAHQRDLAMESLRRFRAEIVENQAELARVVDYHTTLRKELQAALEGPPPKSLDSIHFHGIDPASFDRSAWDLALATQSLAYIDSDLALSLAHVYNAQNRVSDQSHGVLQAAYATPPLDESSSTTFFGSVLLYLGDMVVQEPSLMELYGAILPKIDATLGAERRSAGEKARAPDERTNAVAGAKK